MALYSRQSLNSARSARLRKSVSTRTARAILKEAAAVPATTNFDIFLSHRYLDAEAIFELKLDLEDLNYSVYVDWLIDDLDRSNVTRETAGRLRTRMEHCRCLFFAFSSSSGGSNWMPWELGFCDGAHGKVAILPVLEKHVGSDSFSGQEYLTLYPYVSKGPATKEPSPTLWINESEEVYVQFDSWLEGNSPRRH
jgi:hypothetical protein